MLSVVIPTLNEEARIETTLRTLMSEAPDADYVVADGGSEDPTREAARRAGARVVDVAAGRGGQLRAGAAEARGDWLLFLHADSRPGEGWRRAVEAFMADPANAERAAYFRFALDDCVQAARRLERAVAFRCRRLGLPYGDQGLLIGRRFYEALGGYRPLPLMEDVDLVRRIGRRRLVGLDLAAVTSADRYRRGGYLLRPTRNLALLTLYFLGVPPAILARLYR